MTKGEWNVRLLKTYRETVNFLEEIKAKTSFDYKPLRCIELNDSCKEPTWEGSSSSIKIGYNNDPEALAHELAHGLHEKIRDIGHDDKFGEELSDAIRYFVEKEILPNSKWLKNFKANVILKECFSNKDQFIGIIKSKDFFHNIGWT